MLSFKKNSNKKCFISTIINIFFSAIARKMAPKKQWMKLTSIDRLNEEYKFSVTEFLNYAFNKTGEEHEVRCPCVKCNNTNSGTREVIQSHLIRYGIVKNYTS